MICITISHITIYTKRGVSRPTLTNILYIENVTKLAFYPRVFPCLSILTFSQPSTSYSVHTPELPLRGSSISLHYACSHNTPDSPCSKEITRLHWQVSCTQLRSSYRQGLVIGYRPTTLLYSPFGGYILLDLLRT